MCSARTYSIIAPGRMASTDRNALVDQLELALYAGKLSAYAQGFAVMEAASREFSWNLPMATIARMAGGLHHSLAVPRRDRLGVSGVRTAEQPAGGT